MALSTNALTAPLGRTPRPVVEAHRLSAVVPALVVGLLSSVLLSFGAYALMATDPLGGEPVARATAKVKPVVVAAKAQTPAEAAPETAMAAAAPPQAPRNTISIINGLTGQRNEVEIGSGASSAQPAVTPQQQRQRQAESAPPGTMRIEVAQNGGVKITPADGQQAAEIKRYMDSVQKPATPSGAKVIKLPQ
jgi:hypothetical protein